MLQWNGHEDVILWSHFSLYFSSDEFIITTEIRKLGAEIVGVVRDSARCMSCVPVLLSDGVSLAEH